MEAEFCLMCGDVATKKVAENMFPRSWNMVVLKLTSNELAMLKAIQVMDKSFRLLGAAAKSDAAFTIHEVCACV